MKRLLSLLFMVGCTLPAIAQTVTFSVPVAPCNNDGVLTANITGMTPPLTVVWSTEGTTATNIVHTVTGLTDALTGYSGGPVSITVSDGTSMIYNAFGGAHAINYTLSAVGAVCPALGTVTALATGGTAPYTYQWFNKTTGSVIVSGSPASLPTGRYGIIVTDAAGCKYGSRVRNDSDLAHVLYTSFTATLTATPANCTDGAASIAAISPSAVLPVSYHWSNGATSSTITGLTSGIYSVDIVDAIGCMATTDTNMLYNPFSVFVDQTTVINVPTTVTPATCLSADGAIGTFVSGGTAPYTYSWSNGAVTASQTGLAAGQYMVSVTDANGCLGHDTVLVSTSTPIAVTFSSSPSLCTSPTGNATVLPVGGTPPYSITWFTTPGQSGTTATLLSAGNYAFRVTDAAGCIQSGTVTVPPVNVITATFASTSPLCALANGSIATTPTGGAAPYTYLWNTGATTSGLTSVGAGGYSVRITDNMGCKITAPYYLHSFSPVNIGLSVADATCLFANDGTITATPYGGTAPYSFGWSTGGSTPTISGLGTGHYSMNVTDASGCTAYNNAYVGYDATATSCYCTIEGTVYNDTDNNCTQGVGETGINHAQIYCSGIGYTYTDASGHYSFKVPSGTYTVTETVVPFHPLSSCQTNNIVVTAAAAAGCVLTVDFANGSTPVHNLRISPSTTIPPVPGNTYVQQLTITNEGTLQEDTLQASYKADGQLFAPAFVPAGIFAGSSYHYTTTTVPSLAPGASQTFKISYNVPANIPLGTVVTFRDTVGHDSPVSSWTDDYTPTNNVCNHNAVVVASYDPNFKEVYPKGTGANGVISANDSVLEYTVHFQNTGTWFAQNIVVIDTLDGDLNWTTLHPVYESAPCKISVYQAGPYKVAKFTFSNINLPPQMFDDQRSNGMFTYTINTQPGLAVGTQFRNRASIYFDYNAPILTNTTINTIGSSAPVVIPTNTNTFNSVFTVYPNPAMTSFNAMLNNEQSGTATMNIADVSGRSVYTKSFAVQAGSQTITTDINALGAGVYFVNITANGKSATQKLVIIK